MCRLKVSPLFKFTVRIPSLSLSLLRRLSSSDLAIRAGINIFLEGRDWTKGGEGVLCFNMKFLQKITHMWRRWDTTQNFFLAYTADELEKQIFIKKNCWCGPIKKQNKFRKYNVALKKNKGKHLELSLFDTCIPKILMIRSTVAEIRSVKDWSW